MKLIFDDFPADLFNLIMHGEFYRATEKDYTRLMRIFNSCVVQAVSLPMCKAKDEAICEEMTTDGHCNYSKPCPNKESERQKGEWIPMNPDCRGYSDYFKCSICGAYIYPNIAEKELDYNGCPYCFADMRGDEK